MIALVPCRSGSKRLPGKNFRELGGKPLLAWTLDAAHDSGLQDIHLCTDEPMKAFTASCSSRATNVKVLEQSHPLHRDDCTDYEWISDFIWRTDTGAEEFILLRPTSPFRGPETILRALEQWEGCKTYLDSLRAVRKSTEHPFKQWIVEDDQLRTMCPITTASAKKHLHSRPTQTLTDAYVQTAALEVFHGSTVTEKQSIAGDVVGMFLTEGPEALDINTPGDWAQAEWIAVERWKSSALTAMDELPDQTVVVDP